MGIRMITSQADIQRMIEAKRAAAQAAIVAILQEVGEEAVNIARDKSRPNAYTNRTGNLASSVGYFIVQDGKVVFQSNFGTIMEGSAGSERGPKIAYEVSRQFPENSVLVVVAGMEYAIYVERRGYDVLTNAKLAAHEKAQELIDQVFKS